MSDPAGRDPGPGSRRPRALDPGGALDLRPLDALRSFKLKLGVLVVAVTSLAALLTWLSQLADLQPLLAIPLVVAIALVITQLLARGMTSPLREMTRAARAMARGDYTQRIHATSHDEVGQLAEAFSAMAAELEQTDRMRRDLVANVSHELRTPVAGLRAQLENLVDGVTQPDPAALSVALSETERLSRLVDHLLDLSRIDAGATSLEREIIELTPFLHEVADAAALAPHGREVRWLIDVEPPELSVAADPARLHQVIANLLDNAMRHSPPGGLIRLTAAEHEGPGPAAVCIDVLDDGPGIAREDRARVFERFQRGGRSDASGGTGLGLAIARWAVSLHGGTIAVLDDPRTDRAARGRSSLIRVLLPRAVADAPAAHGAQGPPAP